MSKKKSKYSFSKKEKEVISKMKGELQLMGVPRDQWSKYIQEELQMQKNSKGFRSSKFMNKISDGFGKVVGKVASKKLGGFDGQLKEFEDLFKQGSQDEMDFMNQMFPDIRFDNINDLGKHGSTLKKVPQKERRIIDLDFLDDED